MYQQETQSLFSKSNHQSITQRHQLEQSQPGCQGNLGSMRY